MLNKIIVVFVFLEFLSATCGRLLGSALKIVLKMLKAKYFCMFFLKKIYYLFFCKLLMLQLLLLYFGIIALTKVYLVNGSTGQWLYGDVFYLLILFHLLTIPIPYCDMDSLQSNK